VCWIRYLNFKMVSMSTKSSTDEILVVLGWVALLWAVRQVVASANFILIQTVIRVRLHQHFQETFLRHFLIKSRCEWLACQDTSEIGSAVNSGSEAIVSSLLFMIQVLNPITQAIGNLVVLWVNIGSYAGWVVLFLAIVWSLGIYSLRRQFIQRGRVNIRNNPLTAHNVHLVSVFAVERLNGREKQSLQQLIKNSTSSVKDHANVSANMKNRYLFMELLTVSGQLLLMHGSSPAGGSAVGLLALNNLVFRCVDLTWWLFHLCNDAAKNAAEWTPLSRLISRVKLLPPQKKRLELPRWESTFTDTWFYRPAASVNAADECDVSVVPHFSPRLATGVPDSAQIIRLVGDSGCGKSSYILGEVSRLYYSLNGRNICQWIYLDQRMCIPKSSAKITFLQYLRKGDTRIGRKSVLRWAARLRLDKVVTAESLNAPSQSPSGGEEKRVVILRELLPVLCGLRTVVAIFCDEVTAGMDMHTRESVRGVFAEVMRMCPGCRLMWIDHHNYTGETQGESWPSGLFHTTLRAELVCRPPISANNAENEDDDDAIPCCLNGYRKPLDTEVGKKKKIHQAPHVRVVSINVV